MTDSYIGGYSKALLDVKNWFEDHSEILKFNRLYNEKGIRNILWALLENRAELRETGDVKLYVNRKTKEIRRKQENE